MVKRLSWLNLPPWKKKNHEGRVSWCDSGGRWDVLALSGAVPGLWCQFSCSLCVTAGMRVWEVTPTACCLFMPPAGHPFSSASLGWCQCHCLTLLPHSGRARSSCWAPKTALLAQMFLAAVSDLSLLNHQFGSGPAASSQPSCPAEMFWRAQKCEETHSARGC